MIKIINATREQRPRDRRRRRKILVVPSERRKWTWPGCQCFHLSAAEVAQMRQVLGRAKPGRKPQQVTRQQILRGIKWTIRQHCQRLYPQDKCPGEVLLLTDLLLHCREHGVNFRDALDEAKQLASLVV